jgi:hypothetical protein
MHVHGATGEDVDHALVRMRIGCNLRIHADLVSSELLRGGDERFKDNLERSMPDRMTKGSACGIG